MTKFLILLNRDEARIVKTFQNHDLKKRCQFPLKLYVATVVILDICSDHNNLVLSWFFVCVGSTWFFVMHCLILENPTADSWIFKN